MQLYRTKPWKYLKLSTLYSMHKSSNENWFVFLACHLDIYSEAGQRRFSGKKEKSDSFLPLLSFSWQAYLVCFMLKCPEGVCKKGAIQVSFIFDCWKCRWLGQSVTQLRFPDSSFSATVIAWVSTKAPVTSHWTFFPLSPGWPQNWVSLKKDEWHFRWHFMLDLML